MLGHMRVSFLLKIWVRRVWKELTGSRLMEQKVKWTQTRLNVKNKLNFTGWLLSNCERQVSIQHMGLSAIQPSAVESFKRHNGLLSSLLFLIRIVWFSEFFMWWTTRTRKKVEINTKSMRIHNILPSFSFVFNMNKHECTRRRDGICLVHFILFKISFQFRSEDRQTWFGRNDDDSEGISISNLLRRRLKMIG